MRVPLDVSVTGFDDIELAQVVTPALTTIHVPHREMGRKAADALVAIVEGDERPHLAQLQTTLKMRASLGPAQTT